MKITTINSEQNSQNCIFICDRLANIQDQLNEADFLYFQKDWDQKKLQFLKKSDGFLFVFNSTDAKKEDIRKIAFQFHTHVKDEETSVLNCINPEFALAFIEGFMLSNYQFIKYFKDADKKKNKFMHLHVIGTLVDSEIQEMQNLIDSVFWARDRVNEPVSHLDAVHLAHEIEKLGVTNQFNVEVLHKNKIEALKMGGLLAVNKGSITPPTFTIIEYKPENAKNAKPIVLVGKGVVYDTGGLSLKPTPHSMDSMKSDMAGAACMAATIDALAKNKIPVHVIGLIPATDNRPGLEAYTPGDVIHMFDGTTVEVLNTDAEGRMILADALAYANKYQPELVIDAATLTGAAVRALGTKTSISMGNAKDKYFKKLYESGIETHDRVFRLPFWDEWYEEMKSDIADLKNIGGANAGMITAGKFLEHFVKYPYIHLDIAGPAFLESSDSYQGKGGTGAGVRLLYNFLKNWE
jgi:leucyl aminopeptidase